jgi:hypothetical protein
MAFKGEYPAVDAQLFYKLCHGCAKEASTARHRNRIRALEIRDWIGARTEVE